MGTNLQNMNLTMSLFLSLSIFLILSFHLSLSPVQALQVALAEHQEEVDYLTSAVEQVFQKAPPDISQK